MMAYTPGPASGPLACAKAVNRVAVMSALPATTANPSVPAPRWRKGSWGWSVGLVEADIRVVKDRAISCVVAVWDGKLGFGPSVVSLFLC